MLAVSDIMMDRILSVNHVTHHEETAEFVICISSVTSKAARRAHEENEGKIDEITGMLLCGP